MPYLVSGTILAGLSSGYLIGASATPVVGAALPILGGLIMAGFAVGQSRALAANLKAIKDLHESAHDSAVNQLGKMRATSAETVGKLLIAFFAPMIAGVFAGSFVRTHGLFLPEAPEKTSIQNIWNQVGRTPTSVSEAMQWVRIHRVLSNAGLGDPEILAVLKLQPDGGDTDADIQAQSREIKMTEDIIEDEEDRNGGGTSHISIDPY